MTFKVPKGQSRGGDRDPEVEPGEKSTRRSPVTGIRKEKLVLAVLGQVLRKLKIEDDVTGQQPSVDFSVKLPAQADFFHTYI